MKDIFNSFKKELQSFGDDLRNEMLGEKTFEHLFLDIPECYREPLDNKNNIYVLFSGGRGSAKTRSIIRFLLEESFKKVYENTQFLCLMEFQVSIKDGVKPIIEKVIIECHLEDHFRISNDVIINRHTNIEFIFKGARDYSGSTLKGRKSQNDKIKAFSLASIVWLEEAQTITDSTLDVLLPTMRETSNPRLFATFNPRLANDSILSLLNYKGSIRVHKNIFDLPPKYQNRSLLNLADEQKNSSNYDHIWLGKPTPELRGMIFMNVPITGYTRPAVHYVYAFLDPSFKGKDSSALSIIWVYKNTLYVYGLAWYKSWRKCVDEIVTVCKKMGVKDFAYEDNGGLDTVPSEFFFQKGLNSVGMTSKGSKIDRIYSSCEHLVEEMLLVRDGSRENMEYIKQIKDYEESVSRAGSDLHDDAPDSLASCIKFAGI